MSAPLRALYAMLVTEQQQLSPLAAYSDATRIAGALGLVAEAHRQHRALLDLALEFEGWMASGDCGNCADSLVALRKVVDPIRPAPVPPTYEELVEALRTLVAPAGSGHRLIDAAALLKRVPS